MNPVARWTVRAAATLAVSILVCAPASGAALPHISIGAKITEDGAIDGIVRITIVNDTGRPLDSIPLWLYPNRFSAPAPGITDRTVNWLYPSGWSPGSMDISAPVWRGEKLPADSIAYEPMPDGGTPAGCERAIARVALPSALGAGDGGTIQLSFRVEIPKRKGRFGRWRGTMSLGGGWFPRPMPDLTGRRAELPPERISIDLRLAIPAGKGAVVHDRIFERSDRPRVLEAAGLETDILTVVLLDLMSVTETRFPWGTGVYVSRELPQHQPDWSDTRGAEENGLPRGMKALGRIDIPSRGLDVLDRTAAIMSKAAPGWTAPGRVVMVEIPAWDRLTQNGSGAILVSDRLWRILRAEAVLSFHDIALAREIAAFLARPACAETEPPIHRNVTSLVAGAYFGDLFADAAHDGMRSIKDLVGFAAFLPRIDNLLYSPQIPFRESYSIFVEEEDPLRDDPARFSNRLPGGRRILAKLVDLEGEEAAGEIIAAVLRREAGFDEGVRALLGPQADTFFDQWYGDYPSVNYAVASVSDEPLPDGTFRHVIEVFREGADIVEPVTVEIADEAGRSQRVVWDGRGSRGQVEWISDAEVDEVVLDPAHRLIEDPDLTEDHPLADNTVPLPWRPPLLTRLLFWGDTETFEPNIQVGVAMRRQFDVTDSFHLSGSYTPRDYGGSFSYYRHFCAKRTLNSRACYFGPTISVARHEKAESGGSLLPDDTLFAATLGRLTLSLGRDTREYFYDPRSGSSAAVWASYSAGRADDGHAVHVGGGGARGFVLWTPGMGHTFAAYGGVSAVVGEPPATDLVSLSNRLVLRGFELDETYGMLGVYLVLEYRHNIADLSRIGLPLSSFDRLQGALFAGAGTASMPGGYDGLFSKDRIFTEVGYGLRIHILSFGITQYLIALDFAVPLSPWVREYEVEQADGSLVTATRAPFKIVFGITQTY